MKIALVTTPWSSRSGIADYTRHLLPYLREHAEVSLFVEIGREGEDCGEETPTPVDQLDPREYDQILYQLGNEAQHAFMIPMIKGIGGTVVLHDWVLFDLAVSAFPSLAKGGLRGLRQAYAEGGIEQALRWRRSRRGTDDGARGWFAPEQDGRWSAPVAQLPVKGAEALRLRLHVPSGRSWRIRRERLLLASGDQTGEVTTEFALDGGDACLLEVTGAGPVGQDHRPLGVFLQNIEVRRDGEWTPLGLEALPPVGTYGLASARFELPLNHSVVRHADAFIVHSDTVAQRVLDSRNAVTPVYRVHHGVERRWKDGDRSSARRALGLPSDWESCFLLASLGALQAHKRPEVLLEALKLVRERGHDVRLLCVGEARPAEFDLQGSLHSLDLEQAVHITGYLPEEQAWTALHASDLCLNLRGPSTGGTSGGACQALSVGRPVVVSDLPELSHFPDACVRRLPTGDDEVERLAGIIEELCTDNTTLSAMEEASRKAVNDTLHWSQVAERYIDLLKTYPRARAARRSLFIRFVHATTKGRDPAE